MVVYLPPDDAGRDGEGKTPHPTASQTPEHLRTDSECQGTDCGHSTAEWNRDSQYPCGLHGRLQSRPRVVHICLVPRVATTTVYGDCVTVCVCVCVCVYANLYDLLFVFSQETFVRGTKQGFFIS